MKGARLNSDSLVAVYNNDNDNERFFPVTEYTAAEETIEN